MSSVNFHKHQNELIFVPLGGAGEIGMNVNMYHLNGKWIMVDLGIGFAHDTPGVDMLAPDISFAKRIKKDIIGLIITHIHEDHLGAVQYLWEELKIPIYASSLACNFLKAKLQEFPFAKKVKIHQIEPSKNLQLGDFNIEFIGLTHSVPEMNALLIKTEHGNVLHSGDWKFDPDPVVGKVSEKEKIKSYGDKGEILALVSDSTNAMNDGRSKSEGDLFASLKNIVEKRKKLVGVATFASNIARITTVCKVAKACNRKVVLLGFSLNRIVEVAKKSGYDLEIDNIISDREMKHYKRSQLLMLLTGCQGESRAATMKVATNSHPRVKFGSGDTIIFASKIIPGNEKPIFKLFNFFAKNQVEVITERDEFVHVSGHPNKDEMIEMYGLAQPQVAIPVHGEFVHLDHHCGIAKESGVKEVCLVENGSVVKISKKKTEIIGKVETGYFGISGKQLLPLFGEVIKDRKRLQDSGIFVASAVIDSRNYKLIGDISIVANGIYHKSSDRTEINFIEKEIKIKLNQLIVKYKPNSGRIKKMFNKTKINNKLSSDLQNSLKSLILKMLNDLIGKRPSVEVIVKVI
ncbi:ribonuclease J [Flavobacteriaceae bacterium]|nr:ribonuclease J [Flavobacteriaceae bacterium]